MLKIEKDDSSIYEFSAEEATFLSSAGSVVYSRRNVVLEHHRWQTELKIVGDEIDALHENLNRMTKKHKLNAFISMSFQHNSREGIYLDLKKSFIYLNNRTSPASHYYPDRVPRKQRFISFFTLGSWRSPLTKEVSQDIISIVNDFRNKLSVSPDQDNARTALHALRRRAVKSRARRRAAYGILGIIAVGATLAYRFVPTTREPMEQTAELVVGLSESILQYLMETLEDERAKLVNLLLGQEEQTNQRAF